MLDHGTVWYGLWLNISMSRPLCPACNQRFCAVNVIRNGKTYYRSRCVHCMRKNKRARAPKAGWELAGYKKKPACDRCGFTAKYAAQLLVFHVDGNLKNNNLRNLKTVCLNCVVDVKRQDLPWRPGDL